MTIAVRRICAGLIDGVVLMIINITVFLIFKGNDSVNDIIKQSVLFLIYPIYAISFHWYRGQTIGKKIMNIAVLDNSESNAVSFGQAILRDLPILLINLGALAFIIYRIRQVGSYSDELARNVSKYFSNAQGLWFFIEIISLLIDDNTKAVQDKISKTAVIEYNH